jgi:PKD repeat protein
MFRVKSARPGLAHGVTPAPGRRERSRGQSVVEFALVLPIMLLLTLIALDFGRVYLGYINLQNMARIAANFAANSPNAWGGAPNATQTKYKNQILADAAATNCALPKGVGGVTTVPAPTFTDTNGGGIGLGDTVTVRISCTFGVITPFISNIVGGSVAVSAESNFPVKSGLSTVEGVGGGGDPIVPNAAFTGNGVVSASLLPPPPPPLPDPVGITIVGITISDVSPFTVEFRDTSGGSPDRWSWDFGDGTTSPAQDPLNHTFSCSVVPSCTFRVSMTASNANGPSLKTAYMDVTATGTSLVAFTADRQLIEPGMSVTFTDGSASGGTAYAWVFGDGGPDTGPIATHQYSTVGTYDVTLTVTYPAPTGSKSLTKYGYITVQAGLCTVPSLIGERFNDADAIWRGILYKFKGHVVRDDGAPNGNFIITAQSLTSTTLALCTSNIKVTAP